MIEDRGRSALVAGDEMIVNMMMFSIASLANDWAM